MGKIKIKQENRNKFFKLNIQMVNMKFKKSIIKKAVYLTF